MLGSGTSIVSVPSSFDAVIPTVTDVRGCGVRAELPVPENYYGTARWLPEGPASRVGGLYVDLAGAIRSGPPAGADFTAALPLYLLLDTIGEAAATGHHQLFGQT